MITKPGKIVIHRNGEIVVSGFTFKHTGRRRFPDAPFADECAYDAMNYGIRIIEKNKGAWKKWLKFGDAAR